MDGRHSLHHHDLPDVVDHGGPAGLGALLEAAPAPARGKGAAGNQAGPHLQLGRILDTDDCDWHFGRKYPSVQIWECVMTILLTPHDSQQSTTVNPGLVSFNLIWDRVQLVVFFVQETALSILYIYQTRKYLHDASPLLERSWSIPSRGTQDTQSNEQKSLLRQLIWTNILIIALDISLLGIQCADLFYVQGAFKPCVYGIKLKAEFVILNRLINNVQRRAHGDSYMRTGSGSNNSAAKGGGRQTRIWHKRPPLNPNPVEHPPMELGQWSGEHEFRLHSRGSQAPILVPSR